MALLSATGSGTSSQHANVVAGLGLGQPLSLNLTIGGSQLAVLDGQLVLLATDGTTSPFPDTDLTLDTTSAVDGNGAPIPLLDLGLQLGGERLVIANGHVDLLDGSGHLADAGLALTVGTDGNDLLSAALGTAGALLGLNGDDRVQGGDGNDVVSGGGGNDTVSGGNGNDTVSGGPGDDTLSGGNGNDVLIGGTGNDTMTGGAGADTFVFAPGDGTDVVGDFRTAEGDLLDFRGQAYAFHAIDGGTAIDLTGGGHVTLAGVTDFDPAVASGGRLLDHPDTFRFFDTTDGGHFYTTSAAERDQVLATRPDLKFEGAGFGSFGDDSFPGTAPVYRFFDTADGGHFYTISQAERDQVLATRPDLKFEGTAFHEFTAAQGENTDAVYRFFDSTDGGHFYTTSTTERDTVLATRPDLHFEGIAFYAPHDTSGFVV